MVREGRSWSGRERHCCFLNTRDQRFATISAVSGLDVPDDGRAVAVTDWDLDGRPDLWISNRTSPRVRFFHNRSTQAAHWIAFKLQGVRSNRDAIGARLELYLGDGGTTQRIKTLRAGEGFISQSTKWVHFGLGNETIVDHLVVRWPGGDVEQFTSLAPDARYFLKQGAGRAVVSPPRTQSVRLTPSEVEIPEISQTARTIALSRPLVPAMAYRDFADRSVTLADRERNSDNGQPKPILVNLWASWCAPCVQELKEFARHEQRIRQAGVEIVALCVDDAVDGRPANLSRAREILDELKYPFQSGVADSEIVGKLDTLHRSLVDLQYDLPVPSSFLIDPHDQLVVLYKGPLTTEQLLSDVSLLDASAQQLRDAAAPFPGTWITKPLPPYPQEIALKFVERGQSDEAVQSLRAYLNSVGNLRDDAVVADLADVHFLLGLLLSDQGNRVESLAAYQEAVRIDPQYRKARINLGDQLLREKRAAEAVAHFEAALKIEPDDPETLVALGVAHLENRQVDEAVRCYQDARRLQPGHREARANLARLQHAQGRLSEAVALYRELLNDQPESASDANNLAWILATSQDALIYNPNEAVQWAEKACQASQHQDPRFLTTLAAAYSELGRFRDAVIAAKTAIRVAYAAGRPPVAAAVEKHLRFYEAGQSYRQGHANSSR
jgi:tetratricopeptide (TPR) repeat protein